MGHEAKLDYIQNKKLESKQIMLCLAVVLKSYRKFVWLFVTLGHNPKRT